MKSVIFSALSLVALAGSATAAPLSLPIPASLPNDTLPEAGRQGDIGTAIPWNTSLPVFANTSDVAANWTSFVQDSVNFFGNNSDWQHNGSLPNPASWLWHNASWINGTFGNATENVKFPIAVNNSWFAGNFSQYIDQRRALFWENSTDSIAEKLSGIANSSLGLVAPLLEAINSNTSWALDMFDVNSSSVCGSEESPVPPTQYTWGGDWFLAKDVFTITTDTSIASYLNYTDNFSNLSAAVSLFPSVYETLDSGSDLVLFAPNDQGFGTLSANLTELLLSPVGQPILENVLLYHTVANASSEVADTSKLAGEQKTCVETAAVAPVQLFKSTERNLVFVNDAIVVGKVEAANGVIYVIQQVLSPLFYANSSLEVVSVPEASATNLSLIGEQLLDTVNGTLSSVTDFFKNVTISL